MLVEKLVAKIECLYKTAHLYKMNSFFHIFISCLIIYLLLIVFPLSSLQYICIYCVSLLLCFSIGF